MFASTILMSIMATAALAASTPAAIDPLDKVKCVREEVTGSLVQSKKVCHTEREWRAIRSNAEDEARRITRPGAPSVPNG